MGKSNISEEDRKKRSNLMSKIKDDIKNDWKTTKKLIITNFILKKKNNKFFIGLDQFEYNYYSFLKIFKNIYVYISVNLNNFFYYFI